MLKTLVISLAVLGAAAVVLGQHAKEQSRNGRTEKSYDLTVSCRGARDLRIKVPVGTVKVIPGTSDDIVVHAVRSTKNPVSEEARRWLNDSVTELTAKDGAVFLTDHPSWERAKRTDNNINAELTLEVKAPPGMDLTVDVSAGEADIEGSYRCITGKVGAGEVTLGLTDAPGKDSSVSVGAGEITAKIGPGAAMVVSADVGVGEVSGMPGKSREDDSIHLGDSRRAKIGSGGSLLKLHVGTGEVKVSADGRMTALEPEKPATDRFSKQGEDFGPIDVEVDKDLAGLDSDDAVVLADSDKELAKVGPEVEQAMKEAAQEIRRALKDVRPEVNRAMQKARKAMEESRSDLNDTEVSTAVEDSMEAAASAMESAQVNLQGLDEKDMAKLKADLKALRPEIKKQQAKALRAAMDARKLSAEVKRQVQQAIRSARQAIQDVHAKGMDDMQAREEMLKAEEELDKAEKALGQGEGR